jgi:hypothetical protein
MTASTTFVDQTTVITANWLNEVNKHVYAEFNVKNYGAVGDGVTNDKVAIDDCITAAVASGVPAKIVFPTAIYKVTSAIGSYTNTAPLVFDLQGSTIDSSTASNYTALLWFFGSVGTAVPLSANALINESVVVCGNTSTFSPGQHVKIVSTAIWDAFNTSVKIGELNRVPLSLNGSTLISTNYLSLAVPLQDTYNVADSASVAPVSMCPSVKIINGKFKGPSTDQNTCLCLRFQYVDNPQVIGCEFTDFDTASIFFKHTDKALAHGNNFYNSRPSGLGYGVEVADTSMDTIISNNCFEDIRHSMSINNTTSNDNGVVRRVTFISNTVKCSANSLGSSSTFTATDLALNKFTLATPSNSFVTTRRVRVSSTGTLPVGLFSNNEYWTRETATSGGLTSEVKLYNKMEDAIADTNAVDVSAVGSGTHTMQAYGGGDAVDTHGGCDFIKIIGNFISGSTSSGINIECPNVEITGNTILNSFAFGINVRNEADRNGRAIIANNTIMSPNGAGIVLQQGTRGTVFAYTQGTITGNTVFNAGRGTGMYNTNAGIAVVGGTTSLRAITVTGNSVNGGAAEGILISNVRGATVNGNQCYGNALIGIKAFNTLFVSLTGNSVQSATASTVNAINIDATSVGGSSYCTVTGNTVGAQAGVPTGAAIQFGANVTNSSVIANTTGNYPTPVTLGAGAGNIQANNI